MGVEDCVMLSRCPYLPRGEGRPQCASRASRFSILFLLMAAELWSLLAASGVLWQHKKWDTTRPDDSVMSPELRFSLFIYHSYKLSAAEKDLSYIASQVASSNYVILVYSLKSV